VQGKPGCLPVTSKELFNILDDASEHTFMSAGNATLVQKFLFDGDAEKIIIEMKNLVACMSYLLELKLVNQTSYLSNCSNSIRGYWLQLTLKLKINFRSEHGLLIRLQRLCGARSCLWRKKKLLRKGAPLGDLSFIVTLIHGTCFHKRIICCGIYLFK
jgi:hypothetical protein